MRRRSCIIAALFVCLLYADCRPVVTPCPIPNAPPPPIRAGYEKILLVFIGDSITAFGLGHVSNEVFPASGSAAPQAALDDIDPERPRDFRKNGAYGSLKTRLVALGYRPENIRLRVLAWYGLALGRDLRPGSPPFQGGASTVAYRRDAAGLPLENAFSASLRVLDREAAANPGYRPIIVLNIGINDALTYAPGDMLWDTEPPPGTMNLPGGAAIETALQAIAARIAGERGFDFVYNTATAPTEGTNGTGYGAAYAARLRSIGVIRDWFRRHRTERITPGEYDSFGYSIRRQRAYGDWANDGVHPGHAQVRDYLRPAQANSLRYGVLAETK